MTLASTAAAVSLQDSSGAVVTQANGATSYVTPGGNANFSLQATAGIAVWEITFACLNYPSLHGVTFRWRAGMGNLLQVPIPAGDFTGSYTSVVSDGVNGIVTNTGTLIAKGSQAVPVQHIARLATQAALATYTTASGVITITANGVLANIDGVTPAVGDLVLLTMGAAGADNGLYQVTSVGAVAAQAILTRAPDWANGSLLLPGTTVEVSEGTLYGPSTWKVLTTGAMTVGTTSVAIYPRLSVATTGAGSGSVAATGTTMFINAIATSGVSVITKTAGGTQVSQLPTLTPGVPGVGKVSLAIGGSDTSTYICAVQNW